MSGASQDRAPRWWTPFALAVAFAISLAIASLIPPMQSPDEHSHLARAYMISRGQILLSTPPGLDSGGMVDSNFVAFFQVHEKLARDAKARLDEAMQAKVAAVRWGGREIRYPVPGTGYNVPLIYGPHALGFWLGRHLHLGIAKSYQLVRVFCLLSCLGLLAWAFRLLHPPVLVPALLLLPMTVFQMVSPTLDGVTTCLAVLTLSIFLRRVLAKEDLPPAYGWIFGVSVALLASSRAQLVPLLALPFYLAWKRRSRRDALVGVAALIVSAAWTLYALTHTVDLRIERPQSTGALLLHYLAHPGAFLRIVFHTLADSEISISYERSFIGILAWLDTLLPDWSYRVLWIALGLCAAASIRAIKPGEALLARAGLALAALAAAGLVFLAMLVTWTPVPSVFIHGVQGRYFIVPAIILAYATGATMTPRRPRWPGWLLLCATAGVSFYALIIALLARYH